MRIAHTKSKFESMITLVCVDLSIYLKKIRYIYIIKKRKEKEREKEKKSVVEKLK